MSVRFCERRASALVCLIVLAGVEAYVVMGMNGTDRRGADRQTDARIATERPTVRRHDESASVHVRPGLRVARASTLRELI